MTKLSLVLAAFIVAAACQQRDTDAHPSEVEVASRQAARVDPAQAEQAIGELNRRWIDAIQNKDAAAIAALFAEDGVAIYSGEKFEGREAVRRDAEESFKQRPNAVGMFTSERIIVSDDGTMAYDIGTYSGRADPQAPESRGRYLTLWKNVGGEWEVVADIASDERAAADTSG